MCAAPTRRRVCQGTRRVVARRRRARGVSRIERRGGDIFQSIGFECPEHFNPAEFLIDLVSVDAATAIGETSSESSARRAHRPSVVRTSGRARTAERRTASATRRERRQDESVDRFDGFACSRVAVATKADVGERRSNDRLNRTRGRVRGLQLPSRSRPRSVAKNRGVDAGGINTPCSRW